MTDYATLLLAELRAAPALASASELAGRTGLGLATASKVLKILARADLVTAQRGSNGGYRLTQPADMISAAAIIDAIEGPVAITECATDDIACELESTCNLGGAWQKINAAIRAALTDVSLEDLCTGNNIPDTFPLLPLAAIKPGVRDANALRRTSKL